MKLNIEKFKSKYDLPDEAKFKFNVFNPLVDGIIFATSILFVPLLILIILKFTIKAENSDEIINTIFSTVQIVCAAIGCFILNKRDNELFSKTNAFGIYAFIVLPFLFVIILGSLIFVIAGISANNNSIAVQFISIILQTIAEIAIAVILLIKLPTLKERIFLTLKNEWKRILVICILMTILLSVVSVGLGFLSNGTKNQEQLENVLHNSSVLVKTFYIILLFIFSVIVAPFVEELAFRDSIFTGIGNKWFALVISALAFAMVHVSLGDIENIYIYFIPGLVLSATFIFTEGNVTYTWLIHAGSNFIALIIMIVGMA
ncbi:CPBP family intramembrane glutamic endopeptidase [Mesoplasma chauliocola]|nr:CPBP family intramembrane glutamic endopeptidase [Mesoplasma chauliocola]